MSGQRFFIENRPRSRAGRTFRPKIDLAHERGALSGKKQTSLMSEVYCMDCFNIPHMSAVHFHTLQCPPHRCAGHCLRCDRLSHDDFHAVFLQVLGCAVGVDFYYGMYVFISYYSNRNRENIVTIA